MKRIAVLALVFVASSCSKDDSVDEAKKPVPAESKESTKKPPPKPPAKAPVPRDPRVAKLLAAGKDCTWSEYGMAKCATADAIRKVAFNHQGDQKLAASCAGALGDEQVVVRGLAAACMRGFNDSARIPQLATGLDAFEAEKDKGVRVAIAWAFSSGNAAESGVEPRVIALVRKLAKNPNEANVASYLFRSLFPQYLFGKVKPSKAAGDFALDMAKNGKGRVQVTAIEVLGLLRERTDEVCTALVGLTTSELAGSTVAQLAKFGAGCAAKLDPVVALIAKKLSTGKMYASETGGVRALLRKVPLTGKQLAMLRRASKHNVAKAKGYRAKTAKELHKQIMNYKPPTVNKK